MHLIDEQHVSITELGENGGQVAGSLDRRTRRDVDADVELGSDNPGQRRLPEPGRPGEHEVIGRLASAPGRLQHDLEVFFDLALADELV